MVLSVLSDVMYLNHLFRLQRLLQHGTEGCVMAKKWESESGLGGRDFGVGKRPLYHAAPNDIFQV